MFGNSWFKKERPLFTGLHFGFGGGGAPTSECDFWNGSDWAEIAELSTGRQRGGGFGNATQAGLAGGTSPVSSATEEFTAPATINTVTTS